MTDLDYDLFADDEAEDKETIDELKKANKAKNKSFNSIINKKKLSKYELEDVMV